MRVRRIEKQVRDKHVEKLGKTLHWSEVQVLVNNNKPVAFARKSC